MVRNQEDSWRLVVKKDISIYKLHYKYCWIMQHVHAYINATCTYTYIFVYVCREIWIRWKQVDVWIHMRGDLVFLSASPPKLCWLYNEAWSYFLSLAIFIFVMMFYLDSHWFVPKESTNNRHDLINWRYLFR